MIELLQQLNDELAEVVRAARLSLVEVHNGRPGTRAGTRAGSGSGSGAGTIIHPEGLIVTNAHVVRQQSPRVTLWDGRELAGKLLAYDERCDLAAVSVDAKELPALPLNNNGGAQPGQWVVALGHPWGVRGATTAGMVIDIGRTVEGLSFDGELIQVGLHLRPGHSGGPMVDGDGRLVGINTMIAGPDVGLAIPVRTVKRFLKQALGSLLT